MKKLLLLLVLGLVLVSGCNGPGSLIRGLGRCNHVLDCGKNQYCEAGSFKCKDIVNGCETNNDCVGHETCETREIGTGWACPVGEECPIIHRHICELTGFTTSYCEKDSDCVWAFAPNSCCFCPTVYNRHILEAEFKGLVVYEKGKDYSSFRTVDCGDISCAPCAPITELECVNNRCEKIVW